MQLEEHPFISSISPDLRASVLGEIELLTYAPELTVFEEQSEPDSLYLILEGDIAFTKRKNDGTYRVVSQAEAGGFFGEVGIFTGEKRLLAAKAIGNCRIARVPKLTMERIIKDSKPMQQILHSVIHHLQGTTTHYMDEVMRTEKLALVGTMVSTILHDFKNPFSIISLGATLIQQRYPDDPKTARICEDMKAQIQRMVNLANELTAFSRGEHDIKIQRVSVDNLFQTFRELNRPYFQYKDVKIKLVANGATLEADASKFLRVLQNLVGNAVDALQDCAMAGEIEVTAEEKEDWVIFKVSDNGPGIPVEIREHFFEPFVTKGKNEGTGLGAAIIESIIQSHRGSITFESSAQGTTFFIRMPKHQN
ncbi:MAG: ATP-binding protein [Opitutales bacterium]